jgi:hypothetical protein
MLPLLRCLLRQLAPQADSVLCPPGEPDWAQLHAAVTGQTAKVSCASELITKAESAAIEACCGSCCHNATVTAVVQPAAASAFGRRATDRRVDSPPRLGVPKSAFAKIPFGSILASGSGAESCPVKSA